MKIDIQIVDAEGDSVVGGWNTYTHSWNHAFSGIYGQKVNEVVWEVTSRGGTPIPPQDAYGGSTPYGYWKVSFVTDDNESDCAQSRLIVYGCIKYSWGTTFDPSREQETTWYYNFF
jgi:hypothetical protein